MKIKDIKLFYREFNLLYQCEIIGSESEISSAIKQLLIKYNQLEEDKIDTLKCIRILEAVNKDEP